MSDTPAHEKKLDQNPVAAHAAGLERRHLVARRRAGNRRRTRTKAPLPEFIGGYRILAKLGAGGMGTVYRRLNVRLQREVALKVMR